MFEEDLLERVDELNQIVLFRSSCPPESVGNIYVKDAKETFFPEGSYVYVSF